MSRTLGVWRIRRWLRGPGRFYLTLIFTGVVVAYVAVPWVVEFVDTVGGYNPAYYEPKDLQRQDYLKSLPRIPQTFLGWETAFKLVLLVLVGLLWLIAVPESRWRGRRSPRR